MLFAMRQHILEAIPNALVVMEKKSVSHGLKLNELGIFSKLNTKRYDVDFAPLASMVPRSIIRSKSRVLDKALLGRVSQL